MRLRELRRLAGLVEELADEPEDLGPRNAGADRFQRPVERLLAERVVADDVRGRLTDDVRPRHVRVALRLDVARPEVDHDRLARGDLPGSHVVADGRLRAVRDDELVEGHPVLR